MRQKICVMAGQTLDNEERFALFNRFLQLSEYIMQDINNFTRDQLKKHCKMVYGFQISHSAATEAILTCRGVNLEKSDYYDRKKLVEWMAKRMPDLISAHRARVQLKRT